MPRSNSDNSGPLRLFVAVYPPSDASERLAASASVEGLPAHRVVPSRQLHMTLHFIGEVWPNRLDATVESVERSAAGLRAFSLRASRIITLPERGPARLIAAETDAPPPLLELHDRLVHRLARSVKARERGRFLPHITLLRFAAPVDGVARSDTIPAVEFDVSDVHLVRSRLKATGAEHESIHRVKLQDTARR